MLESEFQNKLIQELKRMFKGCIVTKLDASHIQGICWRWKAILFMEVEWIR